MDFVEYLYTDGKKVIITDQVSVTNKLIHKYARRKTVSNVRVFDISQIATQLFHAYMAIHEPENQKHLINSGMQSMRLLLCLKEMNIAFLDDSTKTMSTAKEIMYAINQIRYNQASDAYVNSNDKKILGIKEIISHYSHILLEHDEMDEVMLYHEVDSIMENLIREKENDVITYLLPDFYSAKVAYFFFEELTVLEKKILDHFTSLLQDKHEPLELKHTQEREFTFYKAYGVENEVRNITSIIEEKSIPFGDVAIIYANPIYEKMLRSEFDSVGIYYSFPKGFSASSTDFVSFLLTLLEFAQKDFSYEVLYEILGNGALRIEKSKSAYRYFLKKGIGYGRQRYLEFFTGYDGKEEHSEAEKEYEEFYLFLKALIECFDEQKSCGAIYRELLALARKHTDRMDIFRKCVSDQLSDYASVLDMVGKVGLQDSILHIRSFLRELSCAIAANPGSISIYPYGSIEEIDREHIFVLGLSAENVENVTCESPVLCDKELNLYIEGKRNLAKDKNKQKKASFQKTLEYSSAKYVYCSYSDFDMIKLLAHSPSVLFYELMEQANKSKSDIVEKKYCYTYKPIKSVKYQFEDNIELSQDDLTLIKERASRFSASSLQTLLLCPMQYYYQNILGLPQYEFCEKKSDQWLPPNVKGNVFHHVMQNYVEEIFIHKKETTINMDCLDAMFQKEIADTLSENPAPSQDIMEMEKADIYDRLKQYIASLHEEINPSKNKKQIIGCEVSFENLKYQKEDSFEIAFKGFVDRLDGYVDENQTLKLQIYDYKTGSAKTMKEKVDKGAQIQHHVYAIAMMEWAQEHKEELKERLATDFSAVEIESMTYIFPFEQKDQELLAECSRNEKGMNLPSEVETEIEKTVLSFQQGKITEAINSCYQTSLKKKGEADADEFCKYCKYTSVCRV